ncbi:MAG: 50S ribosomal protein L9 [Candidatus Paceibacterota bacterium]|jgi:large subunit ribosomal protein L9
MKVIFLQDVPRVGKRHDIKEVNDGYAMNFLLPRKLAAIATPQAISELEQRKQSIEIEKKVQEDLLLKNLEQIKSKVVHMKGKADDKGHLFSGIHAKEIVEALHSEHHAEVSVESIALTKPIKEVGEFEVPVKVGSKKSSFKLIIERI